jgi:hypothetical protein
MMSDERPDLPTGLADQIDAMGRDESVGIADAWARIEQHVPEGVLHALPHEVLVGVGPKCGAFRFFGPDGGLVAEVQDRPAQGAATVMRRDGVDLYSLGALVSRMRLPRTGLPEDANAN